MATKYILDPSGNIKTLIDQIPTEESGDVALDPISGEVSQEDIQQLSKLKASSSVHHDVDIDVGDDFGSGDLKFSDENIGLSKVLNEVENDPSFGFINEQTGARQSFKPMYHFSDPESRYFAKEFEILTGYTGPIVGDRDGVPRVDIISFIFEYFIEIIVMLGVVEGFTVLNEVLSESITNHTNTVEKFDLRLGKYSILEYDIITKYIFTILNYPKDHSNFLTRITSLFVGFAAWLTPDEPFYIETIIEEANRKGSKQIENVYDFAGFKNQFVGFGLVTSGINIGLAFLEIVINTAITDSSFKRLDLLTKKFRQEKVWKNELYKYKTNSEAKFFVELDYYYFRFAIERIQVGLKILNRYAHEKSYLNPKHREGPLTRVSGHRTKQKVNSEVTNPVMDKLKKEQKTIAALSMGDPSIPIAQNQAAQNKVLDTYSWKLENSDSQNYKPGMTTRLRALPQLLNLSNSFLKNLAVNKKVSKSTNLEVLSLDKSIEQNFYKHKDNSRRIPKELVKELEDYLESEYVPFYMHDLRTNEILSFHAFIESVSDAFTPEYVSTTGFGRIDEVRAYVKTTRNINLTFTVAATSETDHDFMWYQVNKLVTMVYPQWSEGFMTKDSEGKPFFFPFTQVPTASPLIRIRLGDVLKNNYSRSSLSRLFGSELNKDSINSEDSKDKPVKNDAVDFKLNSKHDNSYNYELMPGIYKVEPDGDGRIDQLFENPTDRAYYEVKHPVSLVDNKIDLSEAYVKVRLLGIDNNKIEENDEMDILNKSGNNIILNVDSSKIIKKSVIKVVGSEKRLNEMADFNEKIMKPFNQNSTGEFLSNNPITNAYESGMSRGIAGFITQLDVNYNESNWETSRIGSKAPMLVKITLNFAPIHDIPPGIDHNGMMRAPVYNVGRVNNQMFGDSHDTEEGIGSGIKNAILKYDKIKSSSENQ